MLNLRNDPNKFMVGSATKLAFGKLDSGWTSQPTVGENYIIPRRRFCTRRCMLLSLDHLEDIELKRLEIKRNINSPEEMEKLMDENSALNRLNEEKLDLRAYDIASYNSDQNLAITAVENNKM